MPCTGRAARAAGALHHWTGEAAPPAAELVAARDWVREAEEAADPPHRADWRRLGEALASADACVGLPEGLLHPDPLPKNLVRDGATFAALDWAGAGRGPRLAPLAQLVWAACLAGGARQGLPQAAVAGYRAHVRLEGEELDRMAAAMAIRPLVLDCYQCCLGRMGPVEALEGAVAVAHRAAVVAERIREAWR